MPNILPLWLLRNSDQAKLLRRPAQPVTISEIPSNAFQQLIDDMVRTMYKAEGIGLAAPQIGRSIRLAVIAPEVDNLSAPLVLINPVLNNVATIQETMEEGCLSIPKVFGPVARATSLNLAALDRTGQPYQLAAHGLLARVIQHEVDHLNGRLFIDRADRITKGQHLL